MRTEKEKTDPFLFLSHDREERKKERESNLLRYFHRE